MAMRTARVPAQFCAMATVLFVGRVQAQTNCLNFACPAGQSLVANPSAVTCANEAGGTCTSVTCCAYQCNSYGCGTGYTNYGSGLQCPSAYYGGCSRDYCCRSTAETTGGTTGGTTDGTTGGTTGGTTDGTTGAGTAAAGAGTCETYTCATTGTTKVGNPAAVACSINTNGGICDDNLCCAFQCASFPCANGAENWGAALQCRSKFHGGCTQEFCCKALSVDTTTSTSVSTIASTTTAAAAATAAPTAAATTAAPTTTNGGNNIAPVGGNTGGGGVIIAGGVESMPGNAVQAAAYGEVLSGLWSATTKHVPQLTPSLMAGFAVATVGAAAAAATAGLVVWRQTGRPQDAEPLVEQLETEGQ